VKFLELAEPHGVKKILCLEATTVADDDPIKFVNSRSAVL